MEMGICYAPSLSLCILRMPLFLILLVMPSVISQVKLSDRPHRSNVSDQEALLGFMSAITSYDVSPAIPNTWNKNVSFCKWTGAICSRRRQRVVSLNVSSMGLEEYGLGAPITTKGDVYSYGIMLLEMLTGKKPNHNMFVEGMTLQKWVSNGFPNHVQEVADKNLLSHISNVEEDKDFQCLSQCISVGLLCTKESPEQRPTMMDIVNKLQNIKCTFLEVVGYQFQSDIWTMLANTSTTGNNACSGESSSTF